MRIKCCAFNMHFHSLAILYQLICRLSCATNLHATVADKIFLSFLRCTFNFCGDVMGFKLYRNFFSCIRDIQGCRLHRGGRAGMVAADWGEGWVWGCTHLSDYSGFNLLQCHMYFLCAYIFTAGCRDPFRCFVVCTGNTETPF